VHLLDTNILFVHHLLTRKQIEAAVRKIKSRLFQLEGHARLNEDEEKEYLLLVNAILRAPFVAKGVRGAVRALQNFSTFADLAELNASKRIVEEAFEIISAAHWPFRLCLAGSGNSIYTTGAELNELATSDERNPYRTFLESAVITALKRKMPAVVGVSITYQSQVLPAITLATLIREKLPMTKIIFGGNIPTIWYSSLQEIPEMFEWCDYLIPFEGETALLSLLKCLKDQLPLGGVPNVVYCSQGKLVRNAVTQEEINSLPTPDYSGLPLKRYLAPAPVFLLYTTRGCYWAKCRFCAVSTSMRCGFKARSPEKVCSDIINVVKRHGARYISFSDDCIPPTTLEVLATLLVRNNLNIRWQCEVRFEKALKTDLLERLKEAGCINLIFGLESYSPNVLSLMDKGTDTALIDAVLENCRRHGVAFNLQFFFGFPGETPQDADLTGEFIQTQAHGAATFSFGTFELHKGSILEHFPNQFGIGNIDRAGGGPLGIKYDFAPRSKHAEEKRTTLINSLYGGKRYSFAGLSINAHTLLFLDCAGGSAMEKIYGAKTMACLNQLQWKETQKIRLERRQKQTLGIFSHFREKADLDSCAKSISAVLLYDYDSDTAVELSPLLGWAIGKLNGSRSLAEIVKLAIRTLGSDGREETTESLIIDGLIDLCKRGLLTYA
jgi:hypothetical protein